MKVLVVEDAHDTAALLQFYLSRTTDAEIEVVENDFGALMEIGVWDDIDVVICDKNLGDLNGADILRWVEKNAPKVRRIMLTGDVLVDVNAVHAHEVFVKPTGLEQIAASLTEHNGG
jgi:DNA-binding NtrC family response regulator